MTEHVRKPIQNLSAVDGLSISQMEQEWTDRTQLYHGYNYTTFPIQEGFEPYDWFQICKLFIIEKGYIVDDTNSYVRKKYDPLTCTVQQLNDNPTKEWGVEVKWHTR